MPIKATGAVLGFDNPLNSAFVLFGSVLLSLFFPPGKINDL